MANASIKATTSELRAILANHSEFAQKTVPQMVRAHSRLCAVQLALRTQPFSVGSYAEKARKFGEIRVKMDIKRVFQSKDDFHLYIENMTSEGVRDRLKKLVQEGKWAQLAEISNKMGLGDSLGGIEMVKRSQLKPIHEKHRQKASGRVEKKPDKFYVVSGNLDGYIKQRVKRVGMSKGGWAECARKIGGLKAGKNGKAADNARGIPQWIKRHKHGGEVKDNTNNAKNPHVIMKNTFAWISKICPPKEQKEAVRFATESMLKSFNHALKAALKSNRAATKESLSA